MMLGKRHGDDVPDFKIPSAAVHIAIVQCEMCTGLSLFPYLLRDFVICCGNEQLGQMNF